MMMISAEDVVDRCVEPPSGTSAGEPTVEWSWSAEHVDRKKEARADDAFHGANSFPVDRNVLRDIVREKFDVEVGRIVFLSSGTFHKAYLITLTDHFELIARVARRFMPRLKTMSEVATMHYLREHTSVPVPKVYHYDCDPHNRLGSEYIFMSKAPGRPLTDVFHSMIHSDLVKLLDNIAALIIQLFAHRFPQIGSLYFTPPALGMRSLSAQSLLSSSAPTPKAALPPVIPYFSTPSPPRSGACLPPGMQVGQIISWPFFGSNRGELSHPNEINRGPWSTCHSYLLSCAEREISGVIRENEGKAAPHRLHLDPDEIISSRHHQVKAVPGDRSDESDEWGLEESDEEGEGPGDAMYRDYRRMQRGTFLFAHMAKREATVRAETQRWIRLMERLGVAHGTETEEFGLDLHDLSLENIFVDETDPAMITCIIDWESTTTRPLWACAHVPAFLQASSFTASLFRAAVSKLASPAPPAMAAATEPAREPAPVIAMAGEHNVPSPAREWLRYESSGTLLRFAHRFAEWDGWEEGLVDSMLGPEEHEEETWFPDTSTSAGRPPEGSSGSPALAAAGGTGKSGRHRRPGVRLPFGRQKDDERTLEAAGGKAGELGRRLEAWLHMSGNEQGRIGNGRRWVEARHEDCYSMPSYSSLGKYRYDALG